MNVVYYTHRLVTSYFQLTSRCFRLYFSYLKMCLYRSYVKAEFSLSEQPQDQKALVCWQPSSILPFGQHCLRIYSGYNLAEIIL